jgi:hypothetical protein
MQITSTVDPFIVELVMYSLLPLQKNCSREKVSQGFRNVLKRGAVTPIPILESHYSLEDIVEGDFKRLKIGSDTWTWLEYWFVKRQKLLLGIK